MRSIDASRRHNSDATDASATLDINFELLIGLTGGRYGKHDTSCPSCGPERRTLSNRKRRVFRVWQPDNDFITYCCARCGLKGHAKRKDATGDATVRPAQREPRSATPIIDDDKADNIKRALCIWKEAVPLKGTVGEVYLRSRSLECDEDLHHVLRFHPRLWLKPEGRHVVGIVALFTDIIDDQPYGIHRIFLEKDGRRIANEEYRRMMLGRSSGAAIKLDRDEDVTLGLHIGEGIETGLAGRQIGCRPTWALGCVDAIGDFPVLSGIDALTIFLERNDDGSTQPKSEEKADLCIARYLEAGFDGDLDKFDPPFGDLNDVIKRAGNVS